jgi:RNA polymerase sigma-70 factor (ECF subfamily)
VEMMDLEDIWEEYYTPLQKFISKKVYDQVSVDDILQVVFLKINNHLHQVRDEQKLKSWIYKVTRNVIIDYYRTQKHTEKLPDNIDIPIENKVENYTQEVANCLASTMNVLPEKYREVLQLSELDGLSQKDISERLGISYSTAKSRVQRGRKKLKDLLEGCCHIESDTYGNIVDFRIRFRY